MSYLRRAFLGFAFGVGGMVLLSVPAQAQNSIIGTVIQGQSGGTPIGGAVGVNCSTNVICSIVAGILQVSVSGSLFCAPVGSPTANAVLFDNGSGCPADATKSATIPGLAVVSGGLNFQGNISQAAWTTNGLRLTSTPATLTDTSSSGTVAAAYTNVMGGNTIAATMATTYTAYFNTYIKAPVAGSNVTITNNLALGVDSLYSAGNVGIGTTSPTGKLTVAATDTSGVTDILVNPGTKTSGNLIDLQINGTSKFSVDKSGNITSNNYSVSSGAAIYGGGIANNSEKVIWADRSNLSDVGWGTGSGFYFSSSISGNTIDSGVTRLSAGTIAIGNGTKGDVSGTLIVGNVGIGTTSPGAPLTVAVNALGTTTATSALLQNTTASTSGATVQITPSLRFDGHAWNTTATAADNNVRGQMYLLPVSGATPSGIWHWQVSVDNGTPIFSDSMTLTTGGVLRPLGGYAAADGTAGATVTTCTGFKNGLCVSGT